MLASAQRMGGDDPLPSHFERLTACYFQVRRHFVCCHKRFWCHAMSPYEDVVLRVTNKWFRALLSLKYRGPRNFLLFASPAR
jgi:hypothetical protein